MTARDTQNNRCDIRLQPSKLHSPRTSGPQTNNKQLTTGSTDASLSGGYRKWGERPVACEGHSDYTTYETAYRTAQIDRREWNRENQYSWFPATSCELIDRRKCSLPRRTECEKGKVEEVLAQYYWFITADTPHGDGCVHAQIWDSSGDDTPRYYPLSGATDELRDRTRWPQARVAKMSLLAVSLDAGLRSIGETTMDQISRT